MKLDSRLEMVASFVEPDSVVADIGTDHGYLISYLVSKQIANCGYATDINEMPLQAARETIAQRGLGDNIQTILCDGFSSLQELKIDTIVAAGMGGELIASMIAKAPWVHRQGVSMVLQPMTRPEHLRLFLYQNGFDISKEQAVASGYHLYSVMKVGYTGEFRTPTTREIWLGGLEQWRDVTTLRYFEKTKKRLSYLVRSEENPQIVVEMNYLQEEIERILQHADNQ